MTAIKSSTLEAFLRKPSAEIGFILIYGEDGSSVHDLARRVVAKLAGSLDDPFAVAGFDDSALAGDPGRLLDEVQSQSLLGGSRVVWVRGADQNFLKAMEPVLSGAVRGNRVVAEAGNLSKGSALRSLFEDSPHCYALPLYQGSEDDAAETARAALAAEGLRIAGPALALLVDSAGAGRAVLLREVEKLALYCAGMSEIDLADVEAICGNATGIATDDLVDAVFDGDVAQVDRAFAAMRDGGADGGRMVAAAHGHAMRLVDLRRAIDRGNTPDQALRTARPPIFFKRQQAMKTQLVFWDLAGLLAAAASLAGAVTQSRLNSRLSEALANRALLAIARNARSNRTRIN